MEIKLRSKQHWPVGMRVLVGMVTFALTATSAFGVIDIARQGTLTAILHMLMTADGRLYFILAGLVGFTAGCAVFLRPKGQ